MFYLLANLPHGSRVLIRRQKGTPLCSEILRLIGKNLRPSRQQFEDDTRRQFSALSKPRSVHGRGRTCAGTVILLVQCMVHCWFPWAGHLLKYKYIFQVKCTEAILSNSTRKLLRFEITKMLIAV